jgi:MFS family permease
LPSGGDHGPGGFATEAATTTERVANHDHARAVIEHRFDLDFANDVDDARQHVVGGQHTCSGGSGFHQPSTIACRLTDRVSDQRCRLRHVQPQAACPPGASQFGGGEDEQPIAIGWCEAHAPHANVGTIKRSALDNKVLVRFTIAYFLTALAEWALFVAALVYAFDRGGSRTAGFASMALLVPIALAAPAAGKAAHHRRPERVRLFAYSVQTVALAVAAAAAFAQAPVAVVVGCCAIATGVFTFLGPACAVLLPAIVRSARELTVANVWIGSCESVSTLAGSALATLLLAVSGPALVLAVCAALNLVSTLVTARRIDPGGASGPAHHPNATEAVGAVRLVFRNIRALRERSGATGVLAIAAGQYVLVGAFDLIVVVLAKDQLGLGESGPGLLATSVGVGALFCALTSTFLVRRERLGPLLVGAVASVVVVSFALGFAPALATALLLLPVVGFSRALLDLTSRMLLQRATPPNSVGAIFAAIELCSGVGMLTGSIITQVLIAADGVDTALIGLGIFFAALLILTFRSLRVADDSADIPVVAISLLRRIPAFALLPPLALEAVARTATEVSVAAGDVVVTEGEQGDRFYAIADGSFDVVIGGRHITTSERGAGFGEVALLANVARTATVTASRAGSLLAIHRMPFLTAVTGFEPSRDAAWGAIRTLEFDDEFDVEAIDPGSP